MGQMERERRESKRKKGDEREYGKGRERERRGNVVGGKRVMEM